MIACAVVGWMAFAIALLSLIAVLLVGRMKMENLEKRNRDLTDERSKLSNQVRIKGIAVDRLTREVKRLEEKK